MEIENGPRTAKRRTLCKFQNIINIFILKSHMKRSIHYNDAIMGRWRLKSPAGPVFTHPFIRAQTKEKHQSSALLAFVWGIHPGPANSPHKWPVTRKMFPFDDVIMNISEKVALVLMTSAMTSQRDFKHCPLYPCLGDCCSRSKFQGQYLTK